MAQEEEEGPQAGHLYGEPGYRRGSAPRVTSVQGRKEVPAWQRNSSSGEEGACARGASGLEGDCRAWAQTSHTRPPPPPRAEQSRAARRPFHALEEKAGRNGAA